MAATATRSSAEKKDVDKLVRLIKQNGFNVVPGGSGHKKVVNKQGQPVRDSNGPLIISSSPSDVRWRAMTVKRLLDAGVLKADPWDANPPPKKGGGRLTDPDVQEKKRQAIAARSREQQEETQKLRARMEPFIVKLGGWDKYGVKSALGETAYGYLKSRKRVEAFASENAASQQLRQLQLGNTLAEPSRIAWDIFLSDIEAADDAVTRFMQIQREVKGLPPETANGNGAGAAVELPLKGGEALTPPGGPASPPAQARVRPWTKPTLALEVVYHATVGKTDVDFNEVMKLGERVLALELGEES